MYICIVINISVMKGWIDFIEEISFNGKSITVVGSWSEGSSGSYSTWNDPLGDPPEPPDIEIESISYKDIDITDFISNMYIEDIEDLALCKLQEY